MKIYTVTENQLDYDDYPIGSGTVILTTTCEARARLESDYDRTLWSIPGRGGKIGRRLDDIEIEEEDPDVCYLATVRWGKIEEERDASLAEYRRKAAERKAAEEAAKEAKLLEQAQAAWYTLPNPHAL